MLGVLILVPVPPDLPCTSPHPFSVLRSVEMDRVLSHGSLIISCIASVWEV